MRMDIIYQQVDLARYCTPVVCCPVDLLSIFTHALETEWVFWAGELRIWQKLARNKEAANEEAWEAIRQEGNRLGLRDTRFEPKDEFICSSVDIGEN